MKRRIGYYILTAPRCANYYEILEKNDVHWARRLIVWASPVYRLNLKHGNKIEFRREYAEFPKNNGMAPNSTQQVYIYEKSTRGQHQASCHFPTGQAPTC